MSDGRPGTSGRNKTNQPLPERAIGHVSVAEAAMGAPRVERATGHVKVATATMGAPRMERAIGHVKVAAAAIAAPRTIDEGIGIIGPIPHGDGDGWGPSGGMHRTECRYSLTVFNEGNTYIRIVTRTGSRACPK